MSKELIVISGPTASGKTSFAIELALQHQCDIFSADSRQIYKELNIGVAKPDESQLSLIPHHFINHISIHDDYDVSKYERECIASLDVYFKNRDKAILVGGTGLYLNAIVNGLDPIPDIDPDIKHQLEEEWNQDKVKLLDELEITDEESYKVLDVQNSRRIIRALSVIRSTGKRFSDFKTQPKTKRDFEIVHYYIDVEREELYKRINERVDVMVNIGLIEEAKDLYCYKELQALQTVGYSELFSFFDHDMSQDDAIEKIKQHTRNYAKRQITWFKKYILNLPSVNVIRT